VAPDIHRKGVYLTQPYEWSSKDAMTGSMRPSSMYYDHTRFDVGESAKRFAIPSGSDEILSGWTKSTARDMNNHSPPVVTDRGDNITAVTVKTWPSLARSSPPVSHSISLRVRLMLITCAKYCFW